MADDQPLQTVPAAEAAAPLPADCPKRGWWELYQGGWRPLAGYLIDLILLRAAIVPLFQLYRGLPVEPVAWVELTALAVVLVGARSFDKAKGTA